MSRRQRHIRRGQQRQDRAKERRKDWARRRQRLRAFGSGVVDFVVELLFGS